MGKIVIYDWWWKDGAGMSNFAEGIDQEKYSNIKYTGNGFIAQDYLAFQINLAEKLKHYD